jgi:hypothetical protein
MNISEEATCTTCTFSEDFSNYWTAVLFFRHRNGSFHRVPLMANLGLEKQRGGMTVYYTAPYDKKTKVTAFKPVSTSSLLTLSLFSTSQKNAQSLSYAN